MIRRIVTITMLVLMCSSFVTAADQVKWTGKGGDTSWTNGANWDGGKVPGPHDVIVLNPPPGRGPVIDTDIHCGEIRGPIWSSSDTQVVDVVGCSVIIDGWWRWANRGQGGEATININRANVDVRGVFRLSDSGKTYGEANIIDSVLKCKGILIGDGGNGQINIKGNTLLEVEEDVNMGGSRGDDPRSYEDKPLAITMDGGIFRVGRRLMCPSDKDRAGTASIELTAGTIECKEFTHGKGKEKTSYSLNIEEGTLIIDGDVTEEINDDVEAGYITAFGGKDTVCCRYSESLKKTFVTAANPKKARMPSPANRSEDVRPDINLSWRVGHNSMNKFDIYIGTTPDATGPEAKPVVRGLIKPQFDPDIDFEKTYYWRIDAVDESGTVHRGTTWQFTTTDGKTSNPSPADKSENVESNVTLTWKPGLVATNSNVYLADDPEELAVVFGTTGNSFKPEGLELGKTYYWRVDAVNRKWQESHWDGEVWSFTVDSGKATEPKPVDSGQWTSTKATLRWTGARTATAHTVYLSDKLEDVENGAAAVSKMQKQTTYTADSLKEATTYYWRVDELTGGKVVKGDIWKFSTVGMLDLKMDLAVPQWYDRSKPREGTVKPGWYALSSPEWADMYMSDGVWFPGGKTKPDAETILDSGVQLYMNNGKGGNGTVMAHGMCRGSLAGDLPIYGVPEGDPIANTYFFSCDWAGQKNGDAFVILRGLPAGVYEVKSYHNHWEPTTQGTRNCHHSESGMPPMPSVSANPVPVKPLPGYRGWDHPKGTGKGVTSLLEAKNIKVSSVLSDDDVTISLIRFATDGSDVLIIYEAADNSYPDRARSGREGSRGIWNALELKMISWAK